MNIIVCLNSDLNETTNPVIELPLTVFSNYFSAISNKWCVHEDILFEWWVYWKIWLMKLYLLFCLCYQILSNYILYDMVCLINDTTMWTLDDSDIEELYFWTFLEGIIKDCIKLFGQYFRANAVLCCQDYIICFN